MTLLTIVWNSILQWTYKTNKTLPSIPFVIPSLVPLYDSLIQFINTIRGNLNEYEAEMKILLNGETYNIQRKKKHRLKLWNWMSPLLKWDI